MKKMQELNFNELNLLKIIFSLQKTLSKEQDKKTSDKGLIRKVYKEFLKINSKYATYF